VGKASRRKRERERAKMDFAVSRFNLAMDALAADPCETCAFRDPEAWIADPAIPQKLADAMARHQPFYCHQGLETIDNVYQPAPDPSTMKMCAGFARLYRRLGSRSAIEQLAAIRALQSGLLKRYLTTDDETPNRLRGPGGVEALAQALDVMADLRRRGIDPETLDEPDIIAELAAAESRAGAVQ